MKKRLNEILIWSCKRLLIVAIIGCILFSFSFLYGITEIRSAELKGLFLCAFFLLSIIIFGDDYRDFSHKLFFKPVLDIFSRDILLLELLKLFIKWLIFSIFAFLANKIIKTKKLNIY
ncbi:hypothetical protein KKF04_04090, partial [Patescibacteria group bacterium]|nr:hypothetical protein [Patescibacteria group bacterium]